MIRVIVFATLGLTACSSSNTPEIDPFETDGTAANTAQGDTKHLAGVEDPTLAESTGHTSTVVDATDDSQTAEPVSFHEFARHRGRIDPKRPPYAIDDKWRQTRLTWCLSSASSHLDEDTQIEIINDMINEWVTNANLVIGRRETCTDADIQIEFLSEGSTYYEALFGDSVDAYDTVLGSTSMPGDDADTVYLSMDDEKEWTDEYRSSSESPIDLYTVMLHELGHALGMLHSSESPAVMGAYYSGTARILMDDDIAGIQANYGASQHVCVDGYTLTSLPYYEMWNTVWLSDALVAESATTYAVDAQYWVDGAYFYTNKAFNWAYEAAYSGPEWAAGTNYYMYLALVHLEASSDEAMDAYYDTDSDTAWDLYWSVANVVALIETAMPMVLECHILEYGEDPEEW